MTLSGDQYGGLARMLPRVHRWVARGGPEVSVSTIQRRHPRCLCIKATLTNSQNPRRKVGHFSKGEHVVVRIGGREIAEFRLNQGQDSKISPRSSHPSPQKCCVLSEFFVSRFAHLACGDRVAPLKITEPYRCWEG